MSPTRMSKLESAIRVVLDFKEAFNNHEVAGMMQLITEDCIFENCHPAPEGAVYSGKEIITQFWQDFFRESPHAHIEIEEIFSSGFRCIVRWRYEQIEGSGRKEGIRGVDLFKVKDNYICEELSYIKG
jgi:predicted SnoaL-like aldol condensation-catalyzing enzyme